MVPYELSGHRQVSHQGRTLTRVHLSQQSLHTVDQLLEEVLPSPFCRRCCFPSCNLLPTAKIEFEIKVARSMRRKDQAGRSAPRPAARWPRQEAAAVMIMSSSEVTCLQNLLSLSSSISTNDKRDYRVLLPSCYNCVIWVALPSLETDTVVRRASMGTNCLSLHPSPVPTWASSQASLCSASSCAKWANK